MNKNSEGVKAVNALQYEFNKMFQFCQGKNDYTPK